MGRVGQMGLMGQDTGQDTVMVHEAELQVLLPQLHALALAEEISREAVRSLVLRRFCASGLPPSNKRVAAGLLAQQVVGCLREAFVMPPEREKRMRRWLTGVAQEALGIEPRIVDEADDADRADRRRRQ